LELKNNKLINYSPSPGESPKELAD